MRTIKTKVYKFSELDKAAKQKAIEWYRNGGFDYEWYDLVFEDATIIGGLMGIQVDKIYFSGFSSQGDGACFEGNYYYSEDSIKKIKDYAPKDEKLHKIAQSLTDLQAQYGNGISARVKHSGHYYHEYCTVIDVSIEPDVEDDNQFQEAESKTIDLLRDFMKWIYRQLESNWDSINSDESISETIEANEYEFTKDGKRF